MIKTAQNILVIQQKRPDNHIMVVIHFRKMSKYNFCSCFLSKLTKRKPKSTFHPKILLLQEQSHIIYNYSHLKVTLTQPQTKFNSNTNDSTQQLTM